MLPIIFIMPVVQLVILVYAATFEMKNINIAFVDKDLSSSSRELCGKFSGSPFFNVKGNTFNLEEAERLLTKDSVDLIIAFPSDFERSLVRENKTKIQILVNAVNGTKASIGYAYAMSIISAYNQEVIAQRVTLPPGMTMKKINITSSFWFNNDLNYKIYMLPGILVILVTVVGAFLSGMNMVREKEIGTIEQINVTPIKKYQYITGKLVPFWVIGMVELAFGLTVGRILFDIPIEGSLLLLFSFSSMYMLVALGMGLFLSTTADTQQQVMILAWFFMLIFILMSGIFTPADSMPEWAQKLNTINPISYFIKVIRMILLKGSTFSDISREFYSTIVYAVIILSLATWRYKKVS